MNRLFGNRVRVKEITENKEKTEGGIYLPQAVIDKQKAEKHFLVGQVVQIGSGVEIELYVGDTVAYYKNSGLDYEDTRVITEKDIIGTL